MRYAALWRRLREIARRSKLVHHLALVRLELGHSLLELRPDALPLALEAADSHHLTHHRVVPQGFLGRSPMPVLGHVARANRDRHGKPVGMPIEAGPDAVILYREIPREVPSAYMPWWPPETVGDGLTAVEPG